MKNKILISLLALGSILVANPKISNIEITNLKELPESLVKETLPIREGQEYSNYLLSNVYLTMVRTGLISNVNIFPTQVDENNIKLKIVVDEVPNAGKILENISEIESMKQKTEFKIKNIKISGTNKNLNDLISKSPLKVGDYFTVYNAKVLEEQLLSTGLFVAVVPQIVRNSENKTIEVIYNVKEFPKIRSISIKGSELFTEEQLIAGSGLKIGETLNSKLLTSEGSPILKAYRDNGYLWANFKDINFSEDGDVKIELVEGKVSKVIYEKKASVKDNKRISDRDYKIKTQDYVLKRNTYIEEGKPLNIKTLQSTLSELFRTGIFSSLDQEVVEDPDNTDELIVKIIISERPSTAISANISYSTEDSLLGSIKLADTNFLGKEENFDFSVEAEIKGNYTLSFNFRDPWIKDTDRLLAGGSLYLKKEVYKLSDEEKKLGIENIFNKPTAGTYVVGLNGQIGKGITKNLYLSLSPKLLNVIAKNKVKDEKYRKYSDYSLASLGTNLVYDTRDDRAIPKKGIYADLYAETGYRFRENSIANINEISKGTAKDVIISKKTAYALVNLDMRAYHPVYKDKNSMAYRVYGSWSQANTPMSQKLSAGIDGMTLRGEDKSQEWLTGNPYGLLYTAENRTYINDYVQAILFYDGAYLPNRSDLKENPGNHFEHNVGVGARIKTPLGLLRLDYGWDLTPPTGKERTRKGQFNFGFGQTF